MGRASEAERLWRERVRDQRNSGLSVARYCAQHALSESSFYLWRKRLLEAASASMPMVEVITTPSALAPERGVIEIVLPNAMIVRLDGEVPLTRLREVLAVLRESGSAEVGS